jgi:hypothetical protein
LPHQAFDVGIAQGAGGAVSPSVVAAAYLVWCQRARLHVHQKDSLVGIAGIGQIANLDG